MTAATPVVVVGAGLGGLAAACHLRADGHDVVVLEASGAPGGRAGVVERDGYRFDTGPTVLTMPDLIAGCLDAVGVAMADVLTLRPVDPMYRACFPDGSEIRVRHGREAMEHEIATQCGPRDAAAFGPFCDWLGELYAAEMANFIDRNFDSPLDLVRPLAPALALARLGAFRRLDASVGRRFADDRLRRLFTFQSMYAGLAPYEALAVYAVITYMDTVRGVVAADGGMHAVPRALAAAASGAGVQFHYDTRVERILLRDGAAGPVVGVELAGGERIATDIVVANPDLPVAYDTLLPGLRAPRAARRGRFSPSAVVWHAGGRVDLPPGVAVHNVHFGRGLGRVVPRADRRRHAHVRPVDARDGADRRRPVPRAAGPRTWSTPSSPSPTSTAGSTGRTNARPCASSSSSGWPPPATRSTSRSRTSSIRPTGSA